MKKIDFKSDIEDFNSRWYSLVVLIVSLFKYKNRDNYGQLYAQRTIKIGIICNSRIIIW